MELVAKALREGLEVALGADSISGKQKIADEVPAVDFTEWIERDKSRGVCGGCRVVASHVFVMDRTLERFSDLCDRAAPYGLQVCLEFAIYTGVRTLAHAAHVIARSKRGERRIESEQLFTGVFETSLAPDEVLVEAWFGAASEPWTILEESRRHGDFALAGLVRADDRLALFGVAPTPVLADPADPTRGLLPTADLEASGDFKLHLVRALTEKAFAA